MGTLIVLAFVAAAAGLAARAMWQDRKAGRHCSGCCGNCGSCGGCGGHDPTEPPAARWTKDRLDSPLRAVQPVFCIAFCLRSPSHSTAFWGGWAAACLIPR